MGGVVRGHAYLYAVSDHHLYAELFHAPGQYRSHHHVVAAFYFEGSAPQYPGDSPLDLNQIVPAHKAPFPVEGPMGDCGKMRRGNPVGDFPGIGEISDVLIMLDIFLLSITYHLKFRCQS
jgi:hypothetical protein